jgi:hypothetical protein
VISRGRPSFWQLYQKLPQHVRRQAQEAHKLFLKDPGHPSLRFKKLSGRGDFWSVRVNEQYRAVGLRSGEMIEWFWIGTHNDFDKSF